MEALFGAGEEEQAMLGFTARGIIHEYLLAHPHLVLDTKFFDATFKERLMANLKRPDGMPVQDFDAEIGGLMLHSENWQALHLLQEKYREQVKCIYIDPPYNTESNEFIYKDTYQHSSWLSFIHDRLQKTSDILQKSGVIHVSIDDNEDTNLDYTLKDVFGRDHLIGKFVWQSKKGGGSDKGGVVNDQEYVLSYFKEDLKNSISKIELPSEELEIFRDENGPYRLGRELNKWGAGFETGFTNNVFPNTRS